MDNISNLYIWGNSGATYFKVLVIFVILLIVFKVFHSVILNRLNKLALRTKTDLDETFIAILRNLKPPVYVYVALYIALQSLFLAPLVSITLNILLLLLIAYQVIVSLNVLVDYVVKKHIERGGNEGARSAFVFMGRLVKLTFIFIVALFALSNLGVNVSSLLAGLGIGGLAIALALQNVLADLFSAFSIYFDKPFEPGDFIAVGEKTGTVEYIGIKSTRLRALRGEEIVISNRELTSATIHNFKKLEKRRIVFKLGVVYETPAKTLRQVPDIIKGAIEGIDKARFDRAHFHAFNDSSLDFEVVYYLESSDYAVYMDVNQEINLRVKEAFDKAHIPMAYPTRTIYIEK